MASRRRRARPCTRNAALRGFAGARGGRAGEGTMLRTLTVLLLALLGAANVATAAVPETPRLPIIGAAPGLPSTEFVGIARAHHRSLRVATCDRPARYHAPAMRCWGPGPAAQTPRPGNKDTYFPLHPHR